MAALTEAQRQDTHASYMRELSRLRSEIVGALTKNDLRAALDATDDWIEAQQSVFNAALPLPARSVLTAKQKAALFMFVANKRFGVL